MRAAASRTRPVTARRLSAKTITAGAGKLTELRLGTWSNGPPREIGLLALPRPSGRCRELAEASPAGRGLFARYADTPAAMVGLLEDAVVGLLEDAVAEMQHCAAAFGGKTRTFTPSDEHPFVVVLIDELAFLTAYQPERDLRERAEAAIATLTSQGRSVGACVFGALQDPRKEVINLRNLFPTRIALRLDESDQVDMVLGDGARDRGALADQISSLAHVGAGVGYVRLDTTPDPVWAAQQDPATGRAA